MTSKQQILNLLGLATKAGKVISGEDVVNMAFKKGRVNLVFIASDAAKNTKNKFTKKCQYYNVDFISDFTSEELSNTIGKHNRKVIAIANRGFAEAFQKIKRGDDDES